MATRWTTIGNVQNCTVQQQDITFEIADGSRVRISILADDLIRVRIAPEGLFPPNISRAVIKQNWTPTSFDVSENTENILITTATTRLIVHRQPFLLTCCDTNGNVVVADDPNHPPQWKDDRTQVFKTTQPNEAYIGLGWRPHQLVRNGTSFLMRNKPTYDEPETFYSGVPMWYGLRNGRAYAIYFDDTSWGTIDAGASSRHFMSFQNLGGPVDYYYFANPTIRGIIDRYTELTGRPYMPPRWSIGYQQCRWSYTPQSELLDVAAQLRKRRIPCDVIYLDIDYMPGGHALTFDPAKFPDPARMIAELHANGFRVVANISPLLLRDDPKHAEAVRHDCLLKQSDGEILRGRHFYWDEFGGGQTGDCAWLDFSKTATRQWWARQHQSFLELGIDGIWNDLNEPDELGQDWPDNVVYDYDDHPAPHCKTSTQYPLLQTEFSYHLLKQQRPDRRPFVISRGGFAGIQRYATLWTGDNAGDWEKDYKRNIPMGLSMSICGNPHNGHDIGGYFGHPDHQDLPTPELYARWMQSGIFSAFCRQHHDGFGNVADPPRPYAEPWQFGQEVEDICRRFIRLRYQLMPYLYTLFHNAHATGEPIQRPTLLDFQNDPRTVTQDYDFMFGPFMLISPVASAGAETWDTYLPGDTEWIDWWTNARYHGGQTVTTSTPLDRLPIFARAGAIIPMAPCTQYDGEHPVHELILKLYPAAETTQFTLYEDDGLSWAYQTGQYCKTVYSMNRTDNHFQFDIASRQGAYEPSSRHYTIQIHDWCPDMLPVMHNGATLPPIGDKRTFDEIETGCYFDQAAGVLYARFKDTGEAIRLSTR